MVGEQQVGEFKFLFCIEFLSNLTVSCQPGPGWPWLYHSTDIPRNSMSFELLYLSFPCSAKEKLLPLKAVTCILGCLGAGSDSCFPLGAGKLPFVVEQAPVLVLQGFSVTTSACGSSSSRRFLLVWHLAHPGSQPGEILGGRVQGNEISENEKGRFFFSLTG